MLERGSIALLVGSVIFQLVTGLFNTAQFYPWKFFFTTTHYAMSYVAVGALAIHLAVKLPIIRTALARPVMEPAAAGDDVVALDRAVAIAPDDAVPPRPRSSTSTVEPVAGQSDSKVVVEAESPPAPDRSPASPGSTPAPGRIVVPGGSPATALPENAAAHGDPSGGEKAKAVAAQRGGSIPVAQPGVSRRAVLSAAGIAAAVAGLAVAGQTIPFLRWVAVLAPRSGEGPQGLPVNRTAAAAGVGERAQDSAYRLMVDVGGVRRAFSRADLAALPQSESTLPIACVEGWSASAHWSGVRLRDLLASVGEYRSGDVRFESLESGGLYRTTELPQPHAMDASTLIALRVNGADLDLDHGYPCRLIAPNRPGVLQTKWLSTIEVLT
nr:molybdopterin-dependent oxidoreductase [Nocardia sp.]